MDDGYRMDRGMSREQKWVWADGMEKYRTVRTSMGRKYRMRMTAEEIEGRRQLGMAAALGGLVPACIAIMAAAAGLI